MLKHLNDEHNVRCEASDDENEDNYDDDVGPKNAKKREHEDAEEALIQFIIECTLPFSIVGSVGLSKLLSIFDKTFKIPSRRIAAGRLLDQEYDNCMNMIKNQNVTHVSLTLDAWTSFQQYPYLGITIHYFASDYGQKTRTLTVKHLPGSHTSANLCSAVLD